MKNIIIDYDDATYMINPNSVASLWMTENVVEIYLTGQLTAVTFRRKDMGDDFFNKLLIDINNIMRSC
jgi:hypothetical protein